LLDNILSAFLSKQKLDIPGSNSIPLQMLTDIHTASDVTRKRDVTTTVTVSHDTELAKYLIQTHEFPGIRTVGVLQRTGSRVSKDGTPAPVNEIIGIISSRKLQAQEVAKLLRNHWSIENNLHWVKDYVFLEDRQTLRKGNAPQVMTMLRSMVISIGNLIQFHSLSDALHTFQKNQSLHYQFLRMTSIV
jgi:predicted transposase YbfD/YdcC